MNIVYKNACIDDRVAAGKFPIKHLVQDFQLRAILGSMTLLKPERIMQLLERKKRMDSPSKTRRTPSGSVTTSAPSPSMLFAIYSACVAAVYVHKKLK